MALGRIEAIFEYPGHEGILSLLNWIEADLEGELLFSIRERVLALRENNKDLPEINNFLMTLYQVHRNKRIFSLLYHLNCRRLASIALRILGNEDDLPDAVQDIFLRIHYYADSFFSKEPWSFHKWSSGIARNASLRFLEDRKKKENLKIRCLEYTRMLGLEALPMGQSEREPPQIIIGKEEESLVGVLIHYSNRFLTDSEKNLLFLTEHQNLSYKEISGALGIPRNQVGTYLARARSRRIRLMEKHLREIKHGTVSKDDSLRL